MSDTTATAPSEAEIQDAVQRTGGQYTEEEIRNFASMAVKLARAPVTLLLTKMITAANGRESLAKEIQALCPEKSAFACPLKLPEDVQKEIKMKSINVWLANGPKSHKTSIDVPNEEFAKNVYANYEYLKRVAQAYWQQFQLQNPYLTSQLQELLGPEISELKVDEKNKTTMYFKEDFPDRIVILAAFADFEGNLYRKK